MSACPPKQSPLNRVALAELPASPLVSIIVPSYNQGRFIKDTIDSILDQDYRPLRIHVLDGGSTDETVDVLKSYGGIPELEWVSEPDAGVVDAVNKGFRKAAGEILAVQSSDDAYLPGAIRAVVEQFQQSPGSGLIYGDTVKVDAGGKELLRYRIGPWSLENVLLMKTWIPQPSAFFRRELLEACGGWDETIPYTPDTDLWLRMAFRTEVEKMDVYLSRQRMHDAQRDTQGGRIIRDYTRMVAQSPDLAASSRKLRRAAKAGSYLIRIRYNPTGSDLANARNRLLASLIWPQLFSLRLLCRDLLLPARRALSSIKQRLLGRTSPRGKLPVLLPGRILVVAFIRKIRHLAGVLWKDAKFYRHALYGDQRAANGDPLWLRLRNRHEILEPNPEGPGVRCRWSGSSGLHACRVIPGWGAQLMRRAIEEWPVRFAPQHITSGRADVTVIIGFRGEDRLPQLQLVLDTVGGQQGVKVECVVVDLSSKSIGDRLPAGVRYVHVETGHLDAGYSKSWACNIGARLASADIFIFHDADICLPAMYAAAAHHRLSSQGYEAVFLQRYLFYLNPACTERVRGACDVRQGSPDLVLQNWKGGTVAIRRSSFFEIGGFDEGFVDWGGEDDELFDRCSALRNQTFGFIPFVHLWHVPQVGQRAADNVNINTVLPARLGIPVPERIAELNARSWGQPSGPDPARSYAAIYQDSRQR